MDDKPDSSYGLRMANFRIAAIETRNMDAGEAVSVFCHVLTIIDDSLKEAWPFTFPYDEMSRAPISTVGDAVRMGSGHVREHIRRAFLHAFGRCTGMVAGDNWGRLVRSIRAVHRALSTYWTGGWSGGLLVRKVTTDTVTKLSFYAPILHPEEEARVLVRGYHVAHDVIRSAQRVSRYYPAMQTTFAVLQRARNS